MFNKWKANVVYLLVLPLGCLVAYQYGRAACSRDCLDWTDYCFTDALGQCDLTNPPSCFKWQQDQESCWTCGKGNQGSMNGWCVGGDPNQVCVKTTDVITWRRYDFCYNVCFPKIPTDWLQTLSTNIRTESGTMFRYQCQTPGGS